MGRFLDDIRRSFGTEQVVIIHKEGTEDETRFEVEAHMQSKAGMFEVDTPIYEGDVVEFNDPRGGRDRRLAVEVNINNPQSPSMAHMAHTEVKWGKSAPVRTAPVRRLGLENLHAQVIGAASDLFADGHYESAVGEAFKSLEVRVRTVTGITGKTAFPLMAEAFRGDTPILDVSVEEDRSGEDEREGFLALFRGAMLAVRNPRAHELFKATDPQQALEYLGFASLLHRRLDTAEQRLSP